MNDVVVGIFYEGVGAYCFMFNAEYSPLEILAALNQAIEVLMTVAEGAINGED